MHVCKQKNVHNKFKNAELCCVFSTAIPGEQFWLATNILNRVVLETVT